MIKIYKIKINLKTLLLLLSLFFFSLDCFYIYNFLLAHFLDSILLGWNDKNNYVYIYIIYLYEQICLTNVYLLDVSV